MPGYGLKNQRNSVQRHQLTKQSAEAMRPIFLWLAVIVAVSSVEPLEFLKDFLDSVHKERSISTLLLMQRKSHKNPDNFNHLQQLYPTIRLDETQRIQLVDFQSKDTLALVNMDSPEDTLLLSTLAANFNHMREARILIWLQFRPSTEFIEIIASQAAEHKFLSLLIIDKSERLLRLYPFPQANFRVLDKPLDEKEIFPRLWFNFMGKKALTLPDLVPPRSYICKNHRTGGQRLRGYTYHLIKNFSCRHNITLQLQRPLMANDSFRQRKIEESIICGELDLPMTGQLINFRHPRMSRTDCFLGMSSLSIVVPCGTEMTLEERFFFVYGMMPTITFILSYILLTVVEVVFRKLFYMIKQKPFSLDLLGIVLNLRIICCLMAMSIPRGNRLRSIKGQLTMVMSFSGLISLSILNAQYSTLLTMRPQYKHILNFQQLRESNLTVVFNYVNLKKIEEEIDHEFLSKTLPNVMVVDSTKQVEMMASLNTSYAYQIYSYNSDPFSVVQKRFYRKALCKSPQLNIISGLAFSSVLEQNSVYALALRDFTYYAWGVGLMPHWITSSIREYFSKAGVNRLPPESGGNPLKMEDYKTWVCFILVAYAIAICVFVGELFIGRKKINQPARK